MYFNLFASIIVLLSGTPLEIYIFSNMGYLFACAVALIGYWLFRSNSPDAARPVKMPGWMSPVALVIGVFFLFTWIYGGFYSADYILGDPSKRYLFWLGLGILAVYFPLYAWRNASDKKVKA